MTLLLARQPGPSQNEGAPLLQAHAHNDYRHHPPLFKALEHGFSSVQADVFLVGDRLCVAHDPNAIRPERTLSPCIPSLDSCLRRNDRVVAAEPVFAGAMNRSQVILIPSEVHRNGR